MIVVQVGFVSKLHNFIANCNPVSDLLFFDNKSLGQEESAILEEVEVTTTQASSGVDQWGRWKMMK